MGLRSLKAPSFSAQFLWLSLAILIAGMVSIGLWIQAEIESAVTGRTAGVTALYVDSFVSPHLQGLEGAGGLTDADRAELDRLLTATPLGREIVSFKLWTRDGTVLYSPEDSIVGDRFEVGADLELAFGGEVVTELSDLSEAENSFEAQQWDRLIETYAPVRLEGSANVVAVSEFYQLPDALEADLRAARFRGWAIVGVATVIMYLLLVGIARRASHLISAQREELEGSVEQLTSALDRNRELQQRVQRAAARTTALNEQFLRRISADLHDGPAQNVALALLRMEAITEGVQGNGEMPPDDTLRDLDTVHTALDSAITDLRGIARGLRLPEIGELSLADTVGRVISEFEQLTGARVTVTERDVPASASLPVKITVYRVLQEALANSFRHADADVRSVRLEGRGDELFLEIADNGRGFDATVPPAGTLGLVGMRERIELLGGTFRVTSAAGTGTTITVCLPLRMPAGVDG